jgi:hypothetical protein
MSIISMHFTPSGPSSHCFGEDNWLTNASSGRTCTFQQTSLEDSLDICVNAIARTKGKCIIVLFVETPRKFITAKLSIRKPGSSSVLIICDLFLIHTPYVVFPQTKLLYVLSPCKVQSANIQRIKGRLQSFLRMRGHCLRFLF